MSFPKSSSGLLHVTNHPSEFPKVTFYTQNWADPTTWYYNSTRQIDVVLNNLGANLVYEIPSWTSKKHIVDAYHGKITDEDLLVDESSNSYKVEVKVNDVVQTEQDPHFGTGGDFTVDYNAGRITFLSALDPADEVKLTYHLVDRTAGDGSASLWVMKPTAGKVLEITSVETQFSENIDLKDTVVFQPFANPPDVPADNPSYYKSMMDFYNDANGTYPNMPALGGVSWRGCLETIHTLPWNYQSVSKIPSSQNIEIRVWLQHDEPFSTLNINPSFATATFYCLSVDEV